MNATAASSRPPIPDADSRTSDTDADVAAKRKRRRAAATLRDLTLIHLTARPRRLRPASTASAGGLLRLLLSLTLVAVAMDVRPASAKPEGTSRWTFTTLGPIVASPALAADGTLYFGSQDGRLYALAPGARPENSQLKWFFQTGDWIDATPAVGNDGTIYVGSWDGKLYAINPDGTEKWQYNTGAYIVSSPAVAPDGTIYVGSGDFNLHAVGPDGLPKWIFFTGDWIDSSPVVGPDGTVYFGSWDDHVYAVAPQGWQRWRFRTGGDVVSSGALGADGTLYIGSRDGVLYALAPNGVLKWWAATENAIESAPALGADGTIYCTSTNGRLHAFAPEGTLRWQYPAAGAAPLNPIYSSPAVRADGSVVFGTSDYRVQAVRGDGTELWRAPVGDWIDSSPAIAADGTIYIGSHDRKLHALEGGAPVAAHAWPQYRRDSRRQGWQPVGSSAAGAGRLSNLSIRAQVKEAPDAIIGGFVLAGDGRRSLLLRGVGPGLIPFGVAKPLEDPRLEIFSHRIQPELFASNDNWSTAAGSEPKLIAAMAQAGAFPLVDPSADAALRVELAGGAYSAIVSAPDGTRGIALYDLYDLGGGTGTRITNLSARAHAGPGADTLIVGLTVSGGDQSLLLRAVGPAIADVVPTAIDNPRLRLFTASHGQILAENEDWGADGSGSTIAAAANLVGAFPLEPGARDSALIVTLPPGGYTVQVDTPEGSAGIALVELYALP